MNLSLHGRLQLQHPRINTLSARARLSEKVCIRPSAFDVAIANLSKQRAHSCSNVIEQRHRFFSQKCTVGLKQTLRQSFIKPLSISPLLSRHKGGLVSPRAMDRASKGMGGASKAMDGAPSEFQERRPSLLHRIDALDKSFSAKLYGGGRAHLRGFFKFLELSGTGTIWVPLIIALWLAPFDYSPFLRGLAFNLLVGFLLDLALIGTIKGLVRRPRPKYNREFSVLVPVDVYSFPSGHTSRAIFIASFLCFCIYANKGSLLAGTTAVNACLGVALWAVSTASSRIFLGRHYFLDVVAGCLLGMLELAILVSFFWVSEPASSRYHALFWRTVFGRLKI